MKDSRSDQEGPGERDAGESGNPHGVRLYEPLRRFAEVAISRLAMPEERAQNPVVAVPWPDWRQGDDGAFRADPYQLELRLDDAALQTVPEYGQALDALRGDTRIAPQLGSLVGTMLGQGRLDESMLLRGLVHGGLDLAQGLVFDAASFDAYYAELESFLLTPTITVTTLTPVAGLGGPPAGKAELSAETELSPLTAAEIIRCLRIGVLPTMSPTFFANQPPLWGLRTTSALPKLINVTTTDLAPFEAFHAHCDRERDDALAVLRLHKRGRLHPLATIRYQSAQFGIGAGTSVALLGAAAHYMFVTYELVEADLDELRGLAAEFHAPEVRRHESLVNALRRLSYAGERGRDEDRLVDLMIAAESLFLGGGRDTELRFRLSLRAAMLLGRDAAERRSLFRTMRNAYDVRSAVVHGGQPEKRLLEAIDGQPRSLPEFTEAVEDIIRGGLRRLVGIAMSAPHGDLVDWDGLVLGT